MPERPSPALENAVAPGVRVGRIEPLPIRIERNRWKFVGFMIAFTTGAALTLFAGLLLFVGIFALLGAGSFGQGEIRFGNIAAGGFLISLAASWAWALVTLSDAEVRLLRRLDARVPKPGTLAGTKDVLRDMAIAAGIHPLPQLYVIDTPGVNAFALGQTTSRIRIGVTTGLLERIPLDEQRAVFANLIARVLAQDTLWATAVSALMGPIWKMRDFDLAFEPKGAEPNSRGEVQVIDPGLTDWRSQPAPLYGLAVVITEILSWYHREAAWKAAEKADAEGMMLLKDPRSMVNAIQHVLDRNNHVPAAGDAYSQLFFCWAGFGFAPEDDPEMRRVTRLRETLGAEGAPYVPRPNVPGWSNPPVPPRIELLGQPEADDAGSAEA